MSACAIPGCERPAKDHQLMCWPHWCRVPKVLNRAVFDTYRTSGTRSSSYIIARQAAIDAVVAKEAEGGPTKTICCVVVGCQKRVVPGELPLCPEHEI